MDTTPDPLHTAAQLQALLGPTSPAALHKEIDHVHPLYCRWIEAAPFAVLATSGPGGLDASPRGDAPGFAVVEDAKTLLLPERRGNQRADSLRNILTDPRVALLFLVPGLGETLRVNGSARIRTAPDLLTRLAVQGKRPFCVLEIAVQSVYFQCARDPAQRTVATGTAPRAAGSAHAWRHPVGAHAGRLRRRGLRPRTAGPPARHAVLKPPGRAG